MAGWAIGITLVDGFSRCDANAVAYLSESLQKQAP
jgi:hypothetical protein